MLLWFDYSITLLSTLAEGVWRARLCIKLCLGVSSELFCRCSQKNVLSCVKHKWDTKLSYAVTEFTFRTSWFSHTIRYLFYKTLNIPLQTGGKVMHCFLEMLKDSKNSIFWFKSFHGVLQRAFQFPVVPWGKETLKYSISSFSLQYRLIAGQLITSCLWSYS